MPLVGEIAAVDVKIEEVDAVAWPNENVEIGEELYRLPSAANSVCDVDVAATVVWVFEVMGVVDVDIVVIDLAVARAK